MIIKNTQTNQKTVGPMHIKEYKINPSFSGALIEINGNHGALRCLHEDRIYFIIDGTGTFVLNDEETSVEAHDLIFVPKNTPYNIIGTMTYVLVCSPAFNPDDDVFL